MNSARFLFLFFVAILSTAEAQVVIYKGAGTRVRGNANLAETNASPCQVYFVFDFNTLNGNLVIAESKTKIVFDDGARAYGIADIATKPKNSILLTSLDGNTTGPKSFTHRFVSFEGKETKVQITTNFEGNLPQKLSAVHSYTFGTPFAFVGRYSLNFSASLSQDANTLGKSVPEVVNGIVQDFITKKGYTSP